MLPSILANSLNPSQASDVFPSVIQHTAAIKDMRGECFSINPASIPFKFVRVICNTMINIDDEPEDREWI